MDFPLKETGKDAFRYIPALLVPSVAAFLGVMVFTRLLTPEEYGHYVLAMTTISFASIIFGWLNASSLRYFAALKDKDFQEFISTSVLSLLILLLPITAIWYTLTIILDDRLDPRLIHLFRVAILVFVGQAGFSLMLTLLRADRKGLKYSFYSSLSALVRLCLAVSLLYFLSLGPEGILWATAMSTVAIFLWEFVQIYRKWRIKISSFSWKIFGKFASYGLPLIATTTGGLILSISDRYMIEYFIGTEEVGIYSAGYKISQMSIEFCFSILMLAAFPVMISTFEHKGKEETALLLEDLVSIYLLVLIPAVLAIAALSEDIVKVLLGGSFHRAYIIVPWVAGGVFCLGLSQYFNKPFELKKKTHFLLYFLIFSATLNIGLNLYLIPRFGSLGAAFATLIAYLAHLAITCIVSRRFMTWAFPWRTCSKSLAAALGMYLVLSFVPDHFTNGFIALSAKIILGALGYFSILFFLREKTFLKALRYVKGVLPKELLRRELYE